MAKKRNNYFGKQMLTPFVHDNWLIWLMNINQQQCKQEQFIYIQNIEQ